MPFLVPNFAHAFGQTYTLPIPLWLFLFGAATSIVVSFVAISWFADVKSTKQQAHMRSFQVSAFTKPAKIIGVTVFWFVIASGLMSIGSFNLIVVSFWVLLLIGVTYAVAMFGNVWQYFNPFLTMFEGFERVLGKQRMPLLRYPAQLSYYPALLTYFGLIWLELFSNGLGIVPDRLAHILLLYAGVTIVAAWIFGKETWFRYGEFFSVFYALIARVSCVVAQKDGLRIQRPFSGISSGEAVRLSMLIIIAFMFASTAYDTFRETALFYDVAGAMPAWATRERWLYELASLGILTACLLVLYFLAIGCMRTVLPTKSSWYELSLRFALTLLPIAVAYHMAHYFPLLFTNGPLAINYLGDPFQMGWDILGLSSADIALNFYNVTAVWYAQVALIIGGHIAALYAAHRTAGQLFRKRTVVIRSQIPIVALMILYTVCSLWVLTLALAG